MKYQNRHGKKCYNEKSYNNISNNAANSRKAFKLSNKWQIVYNKKHRKYQLVKKKVSPSEYVFYSVLNTGIGMELGVAANMITNSILELYNKLVADQTKNVYIEEWHKSGKNIIVLRGYNHKHLKYIEEGAKFVSLGKHAIYQQWHHSHIMLVLSVFGRKEDIEDIFNGLSYLR